MKIFNNPEFETRVYKLIEETPMPVSTDFVAHHLGINWTTARSLLLNMTVKGKIKVTETTRGSVFCLPEAETTNQSGKSEKHTPQPEALNRAETEKSLNVDRTRMKDAVFKKLKKHGLKLEMNKEFTVSIKVDCWIASELVAFWFDELPMVDILATQKQIAAISITTPADKREAEAKAQWIIDYIKKTG
jgi:hypothetical protein